MTGRTQPWRVVAAALALPALAALGLQQAAAGPPVDNPIAPGMPAYYLGNPKSTAIAQNGSAVGAITSGESELTRARQTVVLPRSLVAANLVGQQYNDGSGRFAFPTTVTLQSPEGAADPFGELPPITTTTLAFGFVPVTVTTTISQRRGADDLPIPLDVDVDSVYSDGTLYDVTLTGLVDITFSDLVIDGRPVDVGDRCRTADPATLDLIGKNEVSGNPGTYYPPLGGDLYGTIDIPAFGGCLTPQGEDLSPLITSALSADANPLHLNQGRPGQNGPTSGVLCNDDLSEGETPDEAVLCEAPRESPEITGLGQIRTTPPNWTPNPSPFPPAVVLPCAPGQKPAVCRSP